MIYDLQNPRNRSKRKYTLFRIDPLQFRRRTVNECEMERIEQRKSL